MDKNLRESHLTLWIRVPLCTLTWNVAGLWQMEPRGRWETDSCLLRAPCGIPGTRWGSRHYAPGCKPSCKQRQGQRSCSCAFACLGTKRWAAVTWALTDTGQALTPGTHCQLLVAQVGGKGVCHPGWGCWAQSWAAAVASSVPRKASPRRAETVYENHGSGAAGT